MKTLAMSAIATLPVVALTNARAANPDKVVVTIDYTDTAAPAGMQAYVAGIKAYTPFLRERGVTFDEHAFSHATGRDCNRPVSRISCAVAGQ